MYFGRRWFLVLQYEFIIFNWHWIIICALKSNFLQLNRLLESGDHNHFGNNKLSGFDEGKGEFYHEVEEYDGEFDDQSQNS